ncbi:DUF1272 domain-containing protein [Neobacillus drentensis]|uniref:DUF1272 domain-containing protein n=1 Tax=Neobacillus drentensis TaxID=220684 RepID=UPI003001D056
MALEMRKVCERCNKPLVDDGDAYICTYECTFCSECNNEMDSNCPNCGGELVKRPRRMKK